MMKSLLVLVLIGSLVGCGVISPPKYSETEYTTLAQIATTAELGHCDIATTEKLVAQTTFLSHYTHYQPSNHDTYESALMIQTIVEELHKRVIAKDVTEFYCTTKLQLITVTVNTIQQASGSKKR